MANMASTGSTTHPDELETEEATFNVTTMAPFGIQNVIDITRFSSFVTAYVC